MTRALACCGLSGGSVEQPWRAHLPCNPATTCAILNGNSGGRMKEVRKVHYVKGVFVCPKCRQSYVQEKWIESWRVRCHRCDYRGTLTDVSVEERMEEETFRR